MVAGRARRRKRRRTTGEKSAERAAAAGINVATYSWWVRLKLKG
jgi:hypothetical protein